jgi:hypothetical protein
MGRFVTVTKDLPEPYKFAHPICVIKKLREMGIDPRAATREQRIEAARKCVEEGKLHGIAKLFRR